MEEIKAYLEDKFKKGLLPSHVLLDQMRVIDEEARKSFAYNDPTYVNLYYWLGEILTPDNLFEIGFGLGLLSGNFLKSCKTVKNFVAVQEIRPEYYSLRLGRANIKDNYKGNLFLHYGGLNDDIFDFRVRSLEFDLVFMNEESSYDRSRFYYDFIWPQVKSKGIIVSGYLKRHKPNGSAFKDFCTSKNTEPTYINTNYGVGLIRKEN